jgi:hypothetical protein
MVGVVLKYFTLASLTPFSISTKMKFLLIMMPVVFSLPIYFHSYSADYLNLGAFLVQVVGMTFIATTIENSLDPDEDDN